MAVIWLLDVYLNSYLKLLYKQYYVKFVNFTIVQFIIYQRLINKPFDNKF